MTIWGKPQGKWIVGSIDGSGQERALMGKWIGEAPAVSYPETAVRLPERLGNNTFKLLGLLALGWFLYKGDIQRAIRGLFP